MSYFNHSFQKTILATGGLCTTASKKIWDLNAEAAGGNPKVAFIGTSGSVKDSILTTFTTVQPFEIAGSTVRAFDKLGKFAEAYQAPNTSKIINPKYVTKLYAVFPQVATRADVSLGVVDSNTQTCQPDFMCGQTYYLQLDIKGSKVASVLMHNFHERVPAFVSCCGASADEVTDPLKDKGAAVYLAWAKYINDDPIAQQFVRAFVVGDDKFYGEAISGDATVGTVEGSIADFEALLATPIGTGSGKRTEIASAGLYIVAAYEDTKFGTCSFDKRDAVNLQPIEVSAQFVDVDGNPCFNACPAVANPGLQATRTGESLLREVILDESYRQNFMSDNARKREIEGSDAIFSYIDKNAQYPGVYIEHNVPRNINPSGTFDNDRYLIQIITTGSESSGTLSGNISDIVGALEGLTGLTAEIFTV